MSWLRVVVVKGSNLPSPAFSPKPAANLQTHRAGLQEMVPPSSEHHAGNILLAQIPFSGLGGCSEYRIFTAYFWLRAQSLLTACHGFWCCSQNPARKPLAHRSPCASGEIQQLWLRKYCWSTDQGCPGSHLISPPPKASPSFSTALTSPQGDKQSCHLSLM